MTKIEFRTNIPDTLSYAVRWVRKAYETQPDARVVFFVKDASLSAKLDSLLWTVTDTSFIAHAKAGTPEAKHSRIILLENEGTEPEHRDIFVNLSGTLPKTFAGFERLIELVSTEESDVAAARERFRHYKSRGYEVTHVKAFGG